MTGAPPLLQMARRACIKTIKGLQDVGPAPYHLVRPILQKIENPEQLHKIELNSPHMMERDAELWLAFIKRDIPWWAEVTLPERPDYDIYCSLRDQAANEVEEDAKRLQQALRQLGKEKATHTSRMIDAKKMGLIKEKPGPPPRKSALPAAVKRNKHMSIPTHRLNTNSKVPKAPISLVEDYKVERLVAERQAAKAASAEKRYRGSARPVLPNTQVTPTKPANRASKPNSAPPTPPNSRPAEIKRPSQTASPLEDGPPKPRPGSLAQRAPIRRNPASPFIPPKPPGDKPTTSAPSRPPAPAPTGVKRRADDFMFIKPKRARA